MKNKNIRVASEGRPKPVTTTRMFPKFSALAVCLLFLAGHFQIDVTFLSTKLLRIFEVTIGYAEKHNQLLLS